MAGIDVGTGRHWVCLVDETGSTLWSRRVVNDEAAVLDTIGEGPVSGEVASWAVSITGTCSALLLALLSAHGQPATYMPERTVNQMSTAYAGEAKTDARDAYVIAETVRHCSDLTPLDVPTTLVTELRLLVTPRTDLVADLSTGAVPPSSSATSTTSQAPAREHWLHIASRGENGRMRDVADLEREQQVLLTRWRSEAAQSPEKGVVPSFDPAGGGLGAPVLVLMEQPARATAAMGAEAVCGADGPSSSVRFFVSCREQSGLSRADYLRWNVIPWAQTHASVGAATPSARRPPGRAELDDAREGLHELLTAMVELRAVVALGPCRLRR